MVTHTKEPQGATLPFYIIYSSGSNIYSKNGKTGVIDFSGTDAATVIQASLNALTSGRTWKEKVLCKGNFQITTSILLPSYTIFEADGLIKMANNMNDALIKNSNTISGNIEIDVQVKKLDGNAPNNSYGRGIFFTKVRQATIKNSCIGSCKEEAILLYDGSHHILIQGNAIIPAVEGDPNQNNRDGISLMDGVNDVIIVGNTVLETNRYGISLVGACNLNLISGNEVKACGQYGIYLGGSGTREHNLIVGNIAENNGIANSNTYDGIHIEDGYSNVIANNISVDNNNPQMQRYGICEIGSSNYNLIMGNNVRTNLTSGITTVGANTIIVNNVI